jgi:uncharacterized protein YndB with AHSA1/START domain
MRAAESFATTLLDRDFVITRVFAAPRERVFQAWTDPKLVAQWWGPRDFTNPICELDARPGGCWRIVMRGPDGTQHPAKGVYRQIDAPRQIVMTIDHSELPERWHDMVNPHRDQAAGRPALEVVAAVNFAERAGKTTLTMQNRFESAELREAFLRIGMAQGWSQSLERLASVLGSDIQG